MRRPRSAASASLWLPKKLVIGSAVSIMKRNLLSSSQESVCRQNLSGSSMLAWRISVRIRCG